MRVTVTVLALLARGQQIRPWSGMCAAQRGRVGLFVLLTDTAGCAKAQKNIDNGCVGFQIDTPNFALANGWIMGNSGRYAFLLLFFGIFFFASGIASASEHLLSPLEAQKMIEANKENPQFIIIDLRSKNEFDDGHIEGAKLVHYYDTKFKRIISQLDRDAKILLYCQKGRQSPLALRAMEKLRFSDMYILDGGFDEWVNAGLPTVYTSF